jgi:hypothetical protein
MGEDASKDSPAKPAPPLFEPAWFGDEPVLLGPQLAAWLHARHDADRPATPASGDGRAR